MAHIELALQPAKRAKGSPAKVRFCRPLRGLSVLPGFPGFRKKRSTLGHTLSPALRAEKPRGTAFPHRGVAEPRTGVAKPRTGVAKPRTGAAKPRTGAAKPRTLYSGPLQGANQ